MIYLLLNTKYITNQNTTTAPPPPPSTLDFTPFYLAAALQPEA